MPDLSNTVAIVTGASRGLGREIALRYSREGARVVLVARSESTLESVASDAPAETLIAPTDVRDPVAVNTAVSNTIERFGRVDILVNNAGVSQLGLTNDRQRTPEVTVEIWDQIIETNLKGPFLFTQAALPHMIDAGHGNIINISSGLGRRAAPGAAPYVSSKWGLEGFTKTVALEFEADGINVNALDPGGRVDTAIWNHLPDAERERILKPDVMNDAAVLLAAQPPGGITGESRTAAEWETRFGVDGK